MKRLLYILIFITGCKEAYTPHLKNTVTNYLVVEGNIVAGNDSTIIHLTRTTTVSDSNVINAESNASVTVESDGGETYPLQNIGNGLYTAQLNINNSKNYRLHIFTGDGEEYASDFVPVKITPPIDSVSWEFNQQKGVNIYVNTHDATNSTNYYRWKYVAAWENRAFDSSELIYDNGSVRQRQPYEQIYKCWVIDSSGEIFLSSTSGLSADVVYKKLLVTIPYQGPQLSNVYSILVTQYALTKEAFEYWDNLKKNTEDIGSIFDPQPFAESGNMHCLSNSSEPVLGYISACSTQQQRIYIYHSQILWPTINMGCKDTLLTGDFTLLRGNAYIPTFNAAFGIYADRLECVDCRLQGGTTNKPPYMP